MTAPTMTGEFRPDDLDRTTARALNARFYRWFALGYTEIQCTPLHLRLSGKRPNPLTLAIDETTPRVELTRGRFWCRLTVHTARDPSLRIGGLDRQGAEAIDQALAAARADLAAARRKAEKVGPCLIDLAEEAIRTFDGTRYVRHSVAAPLLRGIQKAARGCRSALVRHQLDPGAEAALRILEETGMAKARFEESRHTANESFVESAKAQVLQAAEGVVSHPPTDEQAAAVATDEDVTQVLAGAGTGKTAVITCKVAHLARNLGVHPWQILILAFNRKAAKEIRGRLPPNLAGVEARTFHSFGRQVIADIESRPAFSPLARNTALLDQSIRRWLSESPDQVLAYGAWFANEHRSPFDFETFQEYVDFVRSCDLRALPSEPPGTARSKGSQPPGDPEEERACVSVDSLEDLFVANFLALHGIRFEYQTDYAVPMETREDREFERYQPAFLNHVRGAGLSPQELRSRAARSPTPSRNRAFLHLFESIRERYEQELAASRTLDYNDMIIRAARLIEERRWRSPFRYVLVDEFQDISAGRMRLLQALKGDDVAFFVVGDDWQSINRFAGSDVGLFQECERHLGHVETCNLNRTFRYGQSILGPTSDFVQRNPTQTRRELRSASDARDDGITVVAASEQKDGVIEVLDDIEAASIKGGTVGLPRSSGSFSSPRAAFDDSARSPRTERRRARPAQAFSSHRGLERTSAARTIRSAAISRPVAAHAGRVTWSSATARRHARTTTAVRRRNCARLARSAS